MWGGELTPEPGGTGAPRGTLRQGGPREASAWGSASAGLCPGLPCPDSPAPARPPAHGLAAEMLPLPGLLQPPTNPLPTACKSG